jgi:DNA/RNA endonuclease YhcR with UshA esterase domain/protocatechuate 3,4-dioxygenase beta subunit
MKRSRPATPLLALAALLGACGEAAAPEGERGAITVQTYIDTDASGTLTAGDVVLADFAVSLLLDGTVLVSGATGADGRVTFDDLAPDRYTVRADDAAPAGAVLTTNPAPAAIVQFRGGTTTVDYRFAFFPGTLTGRVYRDDDANGAYDPGIDTPGSGLYVLLKAGATVIDSVVTDGSGVYTFALVAPGTYTLEFENPATIDYGASGATRQVTVDPQLTLTTDAVFTGSLVIPIAAARDRAIGAGVTVVGQITVPPNVFTSGTGGVNSELWVQDATGGIALFSVPSVSTLTLGDSVEVSGTLGAFGGQLQINGPAVTLIAAGTPVAPRPVTIPEANALGDEEGRLVSIAGVRIVNVPGGTGAAFTVRGVDANDDTIQIRVVGLNTGLTRASFLIDEEYIVTGILTQFNGTAQLKPRFATDVQGPITIAAARATTSGTVVTVLGNITVPPNIFTSGSGGVNSEIWVQDATGGIAVFSVPSSSTLALGDLVEVTGTVGAFGGQLQLGSGPVVTFEAAGTAPAPAVVTGTEFNALVHEGELVVLPITITAVPGGTGAAFTVTGTAADGQTVQIRVAAANTGLTRASFTVGNIQTVTGILTQFNGTAQVKPRYATDVTP